MDAGGTCSLPGGPSGTSATAPATEQVPCAYFGLTCIQVWRNEGRESLPTEDETVELESQLEGQVRFSNNTNNSRMRQPS